MPKAKRVIYLFMSGGPSHDLWDYKPKMREMFGKDLPEHVRDGQRITGMTSRQNAPGLPEQHTFTKHENNDRGLWVSELLPHTAKVAKELVVVYSTFTEAINHDPAITYIQTGSRIPRRPSSAPTELRSGRVNENLPGYVVMHARSKFPEQSLFGRLWGTGFMPSEHQGVLPRSEGDAVLYLKNPAGVSSKDRRAQLDTLAALNQQQYQEFADPEILARIKQHELAYRMQTSVPELMDLRRERRDDRALRRGQQAGSFAACPTSPSGHEIARTSRFSIVAGRPRRFAARTRYPVQGHHLYALRLIKDLKQRGMLDETLVVWGGEFGRTSYCQGKLTKDNGRDHHPRCFTMDGGGGIKPGITYGQTDDYAYNIADADGNAIKLTKDKGRRHHAHPRPQRDHPEPTWHRSPKTDLSLSGPRLPVDRRPRPRHQGSRHLTNQALGQALDD